MMYASAGRLISLYDIEEETLSEGQQLDWDSAGIIARDIGFRYDKDTLVFDKASFIIEPGQFTAIVGASGEGKTTVHVILSLLNQAELSFYVQAGEGQSGTSTGH